MQRWMDSLSSVFQCYVTLATFTRNAGVQFQDHESTAVTEGAMPEPSSKLNKSKYTLFIIELAGLVGSKAFKSLVSFWSRASFATLFLHLAFKLAIFNQNHFLCFIIFNECISLGDGIFFWREGKKDSVGQTRQPSPMGHLGVYPWYFG